MNYEDGQKDRESGARREVSWVWILFQQLFEWFVMGQLVGIV